MPDKNPIQAANDFIKKGIDAAGAGRPDEARQHFEHSLDFVANNYIALKNLAALAAQQEAFADAEGFLNRIAFEDTTWESWFDLARVRFAQENFDGAKEACVEALTQDSSNTTVLKHLETPGGHRNAFRKPHRGNRSLRRDRLDLADGQGCCDDICTAHSG